jgi:hypothetical protein
MKVLKIIASVVISILLIIVIGSFFLPDTSRVERSINVGVKDSIAYNFIKDFSKFDEWNPWNEIDPNGKTYLEGNMGEVGSLYGWKGEEVGSGNMKVISLEPYSRIYQKLTFIEPWAGEADNDFTIQPLGDSTKITWIYEGKNNGILEKWMGLTLDDFIGKDYEKGLAKLKTKLEK